MISIALAAGNTWGLLLLIALLGYGVAEIPQRLWRNADLELTLRYYQFLLAEKRKSAKRAKGELDKTLKVFISFKKIHKQFSW